MQHISKSLRASNIDQKSIHLACWEYIHKLPSHTPLASWGASMVKCTKKVLRYTKTTQCFGHMPKRSSKLLFELDFFHGNLYCCVKSSNIECQNEIFKTYHGKWYSKEMAKFGTGRKLCDLKHIKVGFFSNSLEFIINLRASLQKLIEIHHFNIYFLSYLKQNWNNYLFNITYLHTTCIVF